MRGRRGPSPSTLAPSPLELELELPLRIQSDTTPEGKGKFKDAKEEGRRRADLPGAAPAHHRVLSGAPFLGATRARHSEIVSDTISDSECAAALDLLAIRGRATAPVLARVRSMLHEIVCMLTALARSARERAATG